MVNGLRKVTRFERDAVGRVIKQLVPGTPTMHAPVPAPEEIALAYDARGQLVRTRNRDADIAFVRDALGRVVEERSAVGGETHVVQSRYDDAGHRVRRTTSRGHETHYDVDGRGMLRGLSFSRLPVKGHGEAEASYRPLWSSVFKRDAGGAEIERRLPGGVVSRWERDVSGRGRVLRATAPWDEGFSRGYQWRAEDQLAAIVDGVTGPLFLEHDARGHLVSARRPDGTAHYRSPDAAGLVYKSRDRSDRSYEKGGVLRRAGDVEYVHDADGQLTEKRLPDGKAWKYRWDGGGQLAEVTRPDGERVTFAYDPLGRRVQKTSGGKTITYVWDGNDLVHELRAEAEDVTWEVEPGRFAPLAKVEGKKRYGVVTDHLGAPVALFDEAGRLAWKAQLDLYGVARTDVMKTHCPWRFPGQYEDEETGLYYNRFRYYDPSIGRYISQDPIRLLGGRAQYSYPGAPFSRVDPFGLMKCGPNDPVDIFRAVGPEEFDDIMQHGIFRLGPNSLGAKQFGRDLGEVIHLTNHFSDMVAIVRARIPQATLDMLDHTHVDRMILRSGSVTAHAGEMLDELNRTLIGPIVHVL
jgi:RHS repeat-associated protein